MFIGNYKLVNPDKVKRALEGSPTGDGRYVGGVAQEHYQEDGKWFKEGEALSKEDAAKLEAAILVEYDRIGGLITVDDDKVSMGSFFDFRAKRAHAEPKVMLEYRINDEVIKVPEGKEKPGVVKAAKMLSERKKKPAKKKKAE